MSSTYFAERSNSDTSDVAEDDSDFDESDSLAEDDLSDGQPAPTDATATNRSAAAMQKAREVASRATARVSATMKRFARRTDDFFSEDEPE